MFLATTVAIASHRRQGSLSRDGWSSPAQHTVGNDAVRVEPLTGDAWQALREVSRHYDFR